MNKLDTKARVQILNMLCQGSSMRAISRITGVSINTVSKLLFDAGLVCARLHDENVCNVWQRSSSATKSGRSVTRRRRTSQPPRMRPPVLATYGRGPLWIAKAK